MSGISNKHKKQILKTMLLKRSIWANDQSRKFGLNQESFESRVEIITSENNSKLDMYLDRKLISTLRFIQFPDPETGWLCMRFEVTNHHDELKDLG
jgi:hypothetical protein